MDVDGMHVCVRGAVAMEEKTENTVQMLTEMPPSFEN